MATPTERIVIEAARALLQANPDQEGASLPLIWGDLGKAWNDLAAAVDALDTEEHANGPREQELTWGQLVAEDEIQSKDGRWYVVQSATAHPNGLTVVKLEGIKAFAPKPTGGAVRVRRSEMGQAVDVIATMLWSR
jgi:hypothetical protein